VDNVQFTLRRRVPALLDNDGIQIVTKKKKQLWHQINLLRAFLLQELQITRATYYAMVLDNFFFPFILYKSMDENNALFLINCMTSIDERFQHHL